MFTFPSSDLPHIIQTITDRIVRDLLDDVEDIQISYDNPSGISFDPYSMINVAESSKTSSIRLTPRTAKSFCRLIHLMKITHHLLLTSQTLSLRAIYYSSPLHFPSYDLVRDTVDKLEKILDCSRDLLNITASSKGLISTGMHLSYDLGEFTPLSPSMIPSNFKSHFILHSQEIPEWILVVEKDAVFNRLIQFRLQSGVIDDNGVLILPRGIVLTGKGFPDIATRALLKALSLSFPSAPIFALVDYNPHGMMIYETYAHGSQSRTRENILLSVPKLHLLGMTRDDVERWKCPLEDFSQKDQQVLENLKNRESVKSTKTLKDQLSTMTQKCDIESLGAHNFDSIFYYIVAKLKSFI